MFFFRGDDLSTNSIRESYDRLAPEYARRIADELCRKPLDRQLDCLAADVGSTGEICDMGCGPGHVARYLRDASANVFGIDLSPKMLEEARRLNPGISFRRGDMLALDLPSEALAGIAAFIPLHTIFTEMQRVLRPAGCVFDPLAIRRQLQDAGFRIEDVIEREPYAPDVEFQSHRAYIFARKPEGGP